MFFIFMEFSAKCSQIIGWHPPLGFAPFFCKILDQPLNMFLIFVIVHKSSRVNNTCIFFSMCDTRITRAINLANKALSTNQLLSYFLGGIFGLIFIANFIYSLRWVFISK